jgi:REP element-mobilizing transposase RayT
MENTLKVRRRSIRLQGYDYTQPGGYYVTLVAFQHKCLFGHILDGDIILNGLGYLVKECWGQIPCHFSQVTLDAYVIMPNHIHGILILTEPVGATHASPLPASPSPGSSYGPKPASLGAIIGSFKSAVSRQARLTHLTVTNIWQRNYYEHVIRDFSDLDRIRLYISSNPGQWSEDDEYPS